MSLNRVVMTFAAICAGLLACSPAALGDGGTLRFSGPRGKLSVTVFTAPEVLRAGPIDLSVLLLDTLSGRPITDIPIKVRASRIGRKGAEITAVATQAAATNKLLQAAQIELTAPGRWQFEIVVVTPEASQPVEFDIDVAPAPPALLQLGVWIAWPVLPIGLFIIREFLRSKS